MVGSRRFSARVSAALIVHRTCATLLAKAQRKAGTFRTLRLVSVAQTLEELPAAERDAPLK